MPAEPEELTPEQLECRTLLKEFKELLKLEDEKKIAAFKESHKDNELFISLADLQEKLVAAISKFYEPLMSAQEEEDPIIRKAMLESHGQAIIDEVCGDEN